MPRTRISAIDKERIIFAYHLNDDYTEKNRHFNVVPLKYATFSVIRDVIVAITEEHVLPNQCRALLSPSTKAQHICDSTIAKALDRNNFNLESINSSVIAIIINSKLNSFNLVLIIFNVGSFQ